MHATRWLAIFVSIGFLAGVACSASAIEETYGRFGPRTLGRPFAPQPRTRFDSGLVRSPSGSFLGLEREGRYDRWYAYRAEREQAFRESFGVREPIASPPVVPPAVSRPSSTRPPVQVEPLPPTAPPPDIWFRSRSMRGR